MRGWGVIIHLNEYYSGIPKTQIKGFKGQAPKNHLYILVFNTL